MDTFFFCFTEVAVKLRDVKSMLYKFQSRSTKFLTNEEEFMLIAFKFLFHGLFLKEW